MSSPALISAQINRNRLGEGALWHPQRQLLFWFDILGRRIHWCDASGASAGSYAFDVMASAAAWIDKDTLLIAAEGGLYRFGIDDREMSLVAPLEIDRPGNRPNDGRCDPWGRFWISTMDKEAASSGGALYILDGDLQIECIKDGLTIGNSIAFSPDRCRAYLADSPDQTIFALDLDPQTGRILGEWVFATTKGEAAVPDGSVVDSEGCLWNAQWNGWRVVRYRPDGTIDRIIDLPVQQPTCPAFGGADLRTLFVTSATKGLDSGELEDQPHAGGVLVVQTDVTGVPEPRFRLP